MKKLFLTLLALGATFCAGAQKYYTIDKSIAVVGNELVTVSDLEAEVQMMRANGMGSDRTVRCEILENMMQSKLLLM